MIKLSSGPAQLSLEPDGTVAAVCHASYPGRSYLTAIRLSRVVLDGREHRLEPEEVVADEDEVELRYQVGGGLLAVVRHTLVGGWGMRLALTSTKGSPVTLDDVRMSMAPGAGQVAWSLAAGSQAAYSVHPDTDDMPILGGVLDLGSVDHVDAEGISLGSITVPDVGRYVAAWRWNWYETPAEFMRTRCPSLPAGARVTTGQPVSLRRDDDAALIVDEHLQVTPAEEDLEISSETPGMFEVEQRSADGTIRARVEWVPTLAEVVRASAEHLLQQPRRAAGLLRVADLAQALVLSHALSWSLVADIETVDEGLEVYSAGVVEEISERGAAGSTPLVAAYLCGEHARTGNTALLDAATTVVSQARGPMPGLGVAATQLVMSLLAAGSDPGPVLRHVRAAAESSVLAALTANSVELEIATLELGVVMSSAEPTSFEGMVETGIPSLLHRLGRHLGAGLPGEPVTPLAVTAAAHLTTVLQLLPEAMAGLGAARWGCPPQVLGSRAVPGVVARLAEDSSGSALAWLLVARQVR